VRSRPAIRVRLFAERRGKAYRYAGFVERPGVRYLGQSVLFVPAAWVEDMRAFLRSEDVDHVVTTARLGAIMPN
jgi:hypothetical protein